MNRCDKIKDQASRRSRLDQVVWCSPAYSWTFARLFCRPRQNIFAVIFTFYRKINYMSSCLCALNGWLEGKVATNQHARQITDDNDQKYLKRSCYHWRRLRINKTASGKSNAAPHKGKPGRFEGSGLGGVEGGAGVSVALGAAARAAVSVGALVFEGSDVGEAGINVGEGVRVAEGLGIKVGVAVSHKKVY